MNVLTTKTKVSEILDENHIILLEDEKTVPDKNSELTDNKTIKIVYNINANDNLPILCNGIDFWHKI